MEPGSRHQKAAMLLDPWQHQIKNSVHDLRHTYATRLLAEGIDIKTVASLLGDTITTVELIYVHYTDEMREKAADDINRIFG